MNKIYVYLYATLITSCMLLADHEESRCHLGPTLGMSDVQSNNEPVIIVGSERKTDMVKSFRQAFNDLSENAKQKLNALFALNQETLSQQQQEMKDAVAIALSEHQAALDRQKYMNLEEQNFLKQKTEAKIAEICDAYTTDKIAFIKHFIRIHQEDLTCYQEAFKEAYHQNKNSTLTKRSLVVGGVVAIMGLACVEMMPQSKIPNKETITLLGFVAAYLLNLGTHLVPAPQDTKFLQHEMEHKQRTIHALEAMLGKIKAEQEFAHKDCTETI